MRRKPREYSLCKIDVRYPPSKHLFQGKSPFARDGVYIFLGEIPNMPGHCVVIDHKRGKIISGYHMEYFVELKRDEV